MHAESLLNTRPPPASSSTRNIGLDLIRGIAVVLVLFRHVHFPAKPSYALMVLERGGWVGVDLFFVLSGFLVSGLLFREWNSSGQVRIGRFLARRALKIYPQFYLLLLATLLPVVNQRLQFTPEKWVGEIFFIQNYLGRVWGHTWSLAVEEHFYLFLPLIVCWLIRTTRNGACPFDRIPWLFGGVAILCQVLRISVWLREEHYTVEAFMLPTHLRMDSLMFGVLLSYLWTFRGLRERLAAMSPLVTVIPGAVLLLPAFHWQSEHFPSVVVFGSTTNYLGAGLVLLGAARVSHSTHWLVQSFAWMGRASYSTYLWHLLVGMLVWDPTAGPEGSARYLLSLFLYLFGSLGLGALIHWCFERPMLILRDRLL